MNRRGTYVQDRNHGNTVKIISATMRVQQQYSKVGQFPRAKEVQVRSGKSENAMVRTWAR